MPLAGGALGPHLPWGQNNCFVLFALYAAALGGVVGLEDPEDPALVAGRVGRCRPQAPPRVAEVLTAQCPNTICIPRMHVSTWAAGGESPSWQTTITTSITMGPASFGHLCGQCLGRSVVVLEAGTTPTAGCEGRIGEVYDPAVDGIVQQTTDAEGALASRSAPPDVSSQARVAGRCSGHGRAQVGHAACADGFTKD